MALDFVTIVSGLPRSGTSLMMQMLGAGGLPLLTDNARPPDQDNPRGYFEFEPVKRLRTDQSWLYQAHGRAVKIIHLLVTELPADGLRFQFRLILMKRSIGEMLASQRVMLERQGKPCGDLPTLAKIYQAQLAQLEQWLQRQPHFAILPVAYHDLLRHPGAAAQEINDFLGANLDIGAMASAVDPSLCHQRAQTAGL